MPRLAPRWSSCCAGTVSWSRVSHPADEFLKSTRIRITSCLIADARMPGMGGLELYGRLVAFGQPLPTVLIAANADEATRSRALSAGVTGFLIKPVAERELLACIKLTLKHNVVLAPGQKLDR
jgi:FixJ family two-component response regulator